MGKSNQGVDTAAVLCYALTVLIDIVQYITVRTGGGIVFRIDYKSGLPIYEQICRNILRLAEAGAFGETGQLPSVRWIAQELGVNPNTVQKAYGILERDGVICTLPGKGSFLTEGDALQNKRKQEALEKIKSSLTEALSYGISPAELLEYVQQLLGRKEAEA